jgi:hypothetical protein
MITAKASEDKEEFRSSSSPIWHVVDSLLCDGFLSASDSLAVYGFLSCSDSLVLDGFLDFTDSLARCGFLFATGSLGLHGFLTYHDDSITLDPNGLLAWLDLLHHLDFCLPWHA